MSGEDDLRALHGYECPDCGWAQKPHPTYGWQDRDDRAVEVHKTQLCPGGYQPCSQECNGCPTCDPGLATPAEPARESDGVGLREVIDAVLACLPMSDDGTGHVVDCGYDDEATPTCGCYSLPGRIAEAIEPWLAARVAEAGARALEEAAERGPIHFAMTHVSPRWRGYNHLVTTDWLRSEAARIGAKR